MITCLRPLLLCVAGGACAPSNRTAPPEAGQTRSPPRRAESRCAPSGAVHRRGCQGPRFVAAASAGRRPDGAFDKGGGWDTNDQAVAVDIGMDA